MSMPINFNSEVRGKAEGQQFRAMTHNWDLEITANPTGVDWPTGLGIVDSNELNVNCLTASVPNSNISTVEGNIRGVRFHQIQTRASTQIQTNLTFYEPADYRIYRFFELWKTAAVSRYDGSQDPACRIPTGVSLVLYNTDRTSKVLEYRLYDTYCGAAQISDPNSSGALQTVTVMLVSSNYGIVAWNAGKKTFAIDEGGSGYLGDTGWVSFPVEVKKKD